MYVDIMSFGLFGFGLVLIFLCSAHSITFNTESKSIFISMFNKTMLSFFTKKKNQSLVLFFSLYSNSLFVTMSLWRKIYICIQWKVLVMCIKYSNYFRLHLGTVVGNAHINNALDGEKKKFYNLKLSGARMQWQKWLNKSLMSGFFFNIIIFMLWLTYISSTFHWLLPGVRCFIVAVIIRF